MKRISGCLTKRKVSQGASFSKDLFELKQIKNILSFSKDKIGKDGKKKKEITSCLKYRNGRQTKKWWSFHGFYIF
jgi:hypothetical protein